MEGDRCVGEAAARIDPDCALPLDKKAGAKAGAAGRRAYG